VTNHKNQNNNHLFSNNYFFKKFKLLKSGTSRVDCQLDEGAIIPPWLHRHYRNPQTEILFLCCSLLALSALKNLK
jgi:hypothetical protein